MVVNGQVQRVHNLYREQLQLNLRPRPREPSPPKCRAHVSERLLLRTEEAINNMLSNVRSIDSLSFGRLCRVFRPTGFQHNAEFNPSWLPTMQRLPSESELAEASGVVDKALRRVPPPKSRYLSNQEKTALFAKDALMQVSLLCRLDSLFESGNTEEFSATLSRLKEGHESDSLLLFERKVFLTLSLDGVA